MFNAKFAARLLQPMVGHDIANLIVNKYLSKTDRQLLLLSVVSVKPYKNALLQQLYLECGFLELLQKCDINFDDHVLKSIAISYGHLHILEWFHDNRTFTNWDEIDEWGDFCSTAATYGHLEVLKWLRKKGVSWYSSTCSGAAKGGHLDVIKWAHANGAPWDTETCSMAAFNGHLEILKWARANGAPWDKFVYTNAIDGDHLEVLKWAIANGCPMIGKYSWFINDDGKNKCIQFLKQKGGYDHLLNP